MIPRVFGDLKPIARTPTRGELERVGLIRRNGSADEQRGASVQSGESTGRVLGSLLDLPPSPLPQEIPYPGPSGSGTSAPFKASRPRVSLARRVVWHRRSD